MKMINKIATAAAGLALVGSSVFAQSLSDAKKAIDAEQYQKAKAMLKNLTVTQPTNAEAFFQLGWVYLSQDYVDSAKAVFNKGIAADPKSALNYVGLGTAAHLANDAAGTTSNFNQAFGLVKKKDSTPFLYIGKGYLLGAQDGKVSAQDATAAIDALNKGKAANEKDADIYIELGNAYRSQLKSNDAYTNYQQALTLEPKSAIANTAIGVLWKYADSFEQADKQFQAAVTIDPNFGPAYREWAESENREAATNRKVAVEKINSAVAHYKTYLNLTDQSDETLLRYADFLVRAGKWDEVQKIAAKLASSASTNARVYRYLGYAAQENKDPKAAVTALQNWFSKADPKRIIPRDYLYLGRAQIASGQDTTKGIATLKKAVEVDSTAAEMAYNEIINVLKTRPQSKKYYKDLADTYAEFTGKVNKPLLNENFYKGFYYYFAYDAKAPDTTLLVKADSALSYVAQKAPTVADAQLYRARIAEIKDADRNNIKGLAKPFYEKYIEIQAPKVTAASEARLKNALVEAYDYMGNYYGYKEKDDVKATEYFNKAKELKPDDAVADAYFKQKAGAKSK
ncbi:tetratricopeptide repeat protein [Mucilaginibacter auburnensis]|uniref:Tetratricopeptide repeat protein n=1 Tax=Mucilaginibacter auburnensis TaxID=1457233 RepID=A0A2H9VSE0_9SPHI|nr:tetratricopeptide repeat protein [Mucilaginibacter auburnensis]PJJ83741.1 tetratricopeptide repeat protein [Mucilaginibacter auburnensis]